ncbi:MAG: hypothetical protein E3J35_02490 [Methanomassiliicoccales archaeon]|nr:MAG: hypothetical protein E3J35_02490 [Methanomassiliicoccales archaeon]
MKSAEPGQPRLLIVGFDALDYRLFEELAQGELCVHSLLAKTPVTGPSWTTIYTGMGRRRHGVTDLWGRRLSGLKISNGTALVHAKEALLGRRDWRDFLTRTYSTCLVPYVWDYLNKAGVNVGLFNLPITYPPRKVKGFHVSGFPIPPKGSYVYPRELQNLIPNNYSEMSDMIQWFSDPLKDDVHIWKKPLVNVEFPSVLERVKRDSLALANSFCEMVRMEDFLMIQFSFLDRIGHVYGINEETKHSLYRFVNQLISFLQRKLRPQNLLVISDHGLQGTTHTDEGVFAYTGGDLVDVDGLKIDTRDITPTVLHLYGIHVDNLEGKTQYGIFRKRLSNLKIIKSIGVIQRSISRYHPRLAVVTDFAVRDVALLYLIREASQDVEIPILFADTGLHFDEAHDLKSRISKLLGLNTVVVFNEQLYGTKQEDFETCCRNLRIIPIENKLSELGVEAYFAGSGKMKSKKSKGHLIPSVPGIQRIELLEDWSDQEVWDFVRDRGIPYNPLYDQGITKILCSPCTYMPERHMKKKARQEKETKKIIENLKRLGYW